MTVQDIMTKSVVVVTEDTPAAQVASLLLERRFSGIPVVSDEQKVLGIITANELFTADHSVHIPTFVSLIAKGGLAEADPTELPYAAKQLMAARAKDIMNQNVLFVRPDLEIEKLAAYIGETWTDAVPVTDEQNHLLGIVTKTDLAKMLGNGTVPPTMGGRFRERPIDRQLKFIQNDIRSRPLFKARANVWVVLFTIIITAAVMLGIAHLLNGTLHIHF